VIIKVERSGGLTGIPVLNEIDTKDLPSTLITIAKKIMGDKMSFTLSTEGIPRGGADYYSYKISVKDGVNEGAVECNEYNIRDDLKSLVKYVERNSKKDK
jgi:hypothetical protein